MDEIVVGLDLSLQAQAALAWAAQQARLTGQSLHAIHALAPPGIYVVGGATPIPIPSQNIESSYRESIRAAFLAIEPERGWALEFMSCDPGPGLVAASQDASMLVIGTREHVGWGRLLSGSVSHYCLSHAHCPVLAVPVELRRAVTPTATVATSPITGGVSPVVTG